jgi:hypothetical protein
VSSRYDFQAILGSVNSSDPTKDLEWKSLEGGSKVLIDAMVDNLHNKPLYGHRVTSVDGPFTLPPYGLRSFDFPFVRVGVAGKEAQYFTHVVSTTSFAALRTIDTDRVPMSHRQRDALRTLNYGSVVKAAIKFKTRWWEDDDVMQRGGSSCTDRQSRVIVYPSYGMGEDGPGVLMVTYNRCVRFSALCCSAYE